MPLRNVKNRKLQLVVVFSPLKYHRFLSSNLHKNASILRGPFKSIIVQHTHTHQHSRA